MPFENGNAYLIIKKVIFRVMEDIQIRNSIERFKSELQAMNKDYILSIRIEDNVRVHCAYDKPAKTVMMCFVDLNALPERLMEIIENRFLSIFQIHDVNPVMYTYPCKEFGL